MSENIFPQILGNTVDSKELIKLYKKEFQCSELLNIQNEKNNGILNTFQNPSLPLIYMIYKNCLSRGLCIYGESISKLLHYLHLSNVDFVNNLPIIDLYIHPNMSYDIIKSNIKSAVNSTMEYQYKNFTIIKNRYVLIKK